MSSYGLQDLIADAERLSRQHKEPCDCVMAIAPLMRRLMCGDRSFLRPEHFRSDPAHYTRNAIHIAKDGSLSLFALVWLPGQWTPIHDHGTWGVVGVVEGVLEERNYIRQDDRSGGDQGIALARGGVILLGETTVTTFVPNPDHIHVTGVPDDRPRAVSLHLYGRAMSDFHVYDVPAGTRKLIKVRHQSA